MFDNIEPTSTVFEGKVFTFHLPGLENDKGLLVPIEFEQLPFHPVRAFLVHAPPGASRGEHGHKTGRQILMRVSGEIVIDLCWRGDEVSVVLGPENNSILITAPVWARQTYRGKNPCLMALCDTPYDPENYLYEKD